MLPDLYLASIQRYKVKSVRFYTTDIIKVIRFTINHTAIEYEILNTTNFVKMKFIPWGHKERTQIS